MEASAWPQLKLAEILDGGIPPYPSEDVPPHASAAVALWRDGDLGAAMWLYADPDDLVAPYSHEIEVARWQDGRWRPLGAGHGGPAPGGLAWRPAVAVAWTTTSQILLEESTLWVLGGVAQDVQRRALVRQAGEQRAEAPDRQSSCLLVGVRVPPVAEVAVDGEFLRELRHWSVTS